jgi:3D (Asp-Asp-Asp) domain-containing protein
MRLLHVLATAYCLSGTTASGQPVQHGAIAVDPRVIRMGARIDVPGYGRGRALDTGSAVKGLHIDLWMRSCSAARRWGARRLTIRVGR